MNQSSYVARLTGLHAFALTRILQRWVAKPNDSIALMFYLIFDSYSKYGIRASYYYVFFNIIGGMFLLMGFMVMWSEFGIGYMIISNGI